LASRCWPGVISVTEQHHRVLPCVVLGIVTSSALVDPNQSPLCGTLGGNMPIDHSCATAAQIKTIKSSLAAGAANNSEPTLSLVGLRRVAGDLDGSGIRVVGAGV
jgi:hypothetical protein